MEIVWALLAICVIALFVLIYLYQARKKAETPLKIMVLGFPGAGKTVFLASMYHKLMIPGREGFSLHVEDREKHVRLFNLYTQIDDTSKDFPPSTPPGEILDWPFVCRVKGAKGAFDAVRFIYLDYAGEMARRLAEEDFTSVDEQFKQALNDADVLLSMLDGQTLLDFMNGKSDRVFYRDLSILLHVMGNRTKPVYFLLTKWDLFENSGYKLSEVLDRLKEIPQFLQFLQGQTRLGSTLRVIPVSSVGKDFVRERNGKSVKVLGAHPTPFQVEMPLACILPDVFEAQIKKLNINTRWWYKKLGTSSNARMPWLRAPIVFFSWFTISFNLGIFGVSIRLFDDGDVSMKPKDINMAIKSKKEALEHTFRSFRDLAKQLEQRFPESNITRL